MKNLAKYLSLFLVLAVLASVFTFAAFADEPAAQAETTVGAYEAPSTAWNPNSEENAATYANIAYGVWASETDYLDAEAPIYWSTSNVLDTLVIGAADSNGLTYQPIVDGALSGTADGNGKTAYTRYVHLYKDASTSTTQVPTCQAETLIINLAGKTLTIPNGIRVGSQSGTVVTATLTIKNGILNQTGGNMQYRNSSKGYYQNLAYTITKGFLNYDDGCDLIEFTDSTLTAKNDTFFSISMKTNKKPIYRFVNTDVVAENSTFPLFRVNVGNGVATNVSVIFDANSSVKSTTGLPIFSINKFFVPETAPNGYELLTSQFLIFEEGCEVSDNIAPVEGEDYKYRVLYYNTSTGKYGPNNSAITTDSYYDVVIPGGLSDGNLTVKVVEPGTNSLITWKNTSVSDGIVKLEEKESAAWKPDAEHAGITYGVWADENEYLNGKAPDKWYTDATLLTANIGTTDDNGTTYQDATFIPAYVRLFSDINNSSAQIIIGDSQKLTIDLGGYTIKDTKSFRIGGSSGTHPNSSLTLKNGYIYHTSGQLQPRVDVHLTFENIAYTHYTSSVSTIFYGSGADLVHFKNSTIRDLAGGGFYIGPQYGNKGDAVGQWIFENSDYMAPNGIVSGATYNPAGSLFYLTDNQYGDANYKFVFDGDSSVIGKVSLWLTAKEGYASNAIQTWNNISVIMEDGFTYSTDTAVPTFEYGYYEYDTSTSALKDLVMVDSSTEEGSKFTWVITARDNHEKILSDYYYGANGGHYNSTRTLIADLSGYQWIEIDPTTNFILRTMPLGSPLGFDTKIAVTQADGTVIKLLADTDLKIFATYMENDLTIDLNGFKLTRTVTNNLELGLNRSGVWSDNDRIIKFISSADEPGILDLTNFSNGIQPRPGTTVYFDNLDIRFNTLFFTDYGCKLISFNDCVITGSRGNTLSQVIGGGFDSVTATKYTNAGNYREIVLEKTTVVNSRVARWTHAVNDNIRFTVKEGCTFDTGLPFSISDKGIGLANLELNIDLDTKFTSYTGSSLVELVDVSPAITVNYTSGGETVEGAYVSYKAGTLNDENFENKDCFMLALRPTVGNELGVNLSLSTDFNVNFFAGAKVEGILLDGAALESVEYNNGTKTVDKYVVTFAAHEAADALAFTVIFNDGEKTFYIPLNYSVLTYANKLTATDGVSDGAKDLAEAAIAYVKEAYKVANAEVENYELPADLAAFATDITASAEGTLPEQLTDAVASIRFELASSVNLIVTIDNNYAGNTIVVNGKVYNVAAGDVVTVEMKAKDLAGDISVSAGNETAVFTLAGYVNSEAVQGTDMEALVEALYTYCFYAKAYAESPDGAELK